MLVQLPGLDLSMSDEVTKKKWLALPDSMGELFDTVHDVPEVKSILGKTIKKVYTGGYVDEGTILEFTDGMFITVESSMFHGTCCNVVTVEAMQQALAEDEAELIPLDGI